MRAVLAGDGISDAAVGVSSTPDRAGADRRRRQRRELDRRRARGQPRRRRCRTSLPDAGVVLCQLEVPLDQVAQALAAGRRGGATTILNPAPAAPLPAELLATCDIVVPNEHEVELLGGVAALLAAGCRAVVVTRGGSGVDVHTTDGVVHCPPFEVEVVDTTGAGDAFCGSLAARLAAGDELNDAVRWAAAAGALATTVVGAVPAQPTADRIRELLDRSAPERRRRVAQSVTATPRPPSRRARRPPRAASVPGRRARGRSDRPAHLTRSARRRGRSTRRRSAASAISSGARMFATTRSNVPSTSASGVVDARIRSATPLRVALSVTTAGETSAMSIAVADCAPASRATIASTPDPVPTSSTRAGAGRIRHTAAADKRVVGWSPRPNVAPGSIATSVTPSWSSAGSHAGRTTRSPAIGTGTTWSRHVSAGVGSTDSVRSDHPAGSAPSRAAVEASDSPSTAHSSTVPPSCERSSIANAPACIRRSAPSSASAAGTVTTVTGRFNPPAATRAGSAPRVRRTTRRRR